ncbi:MAG: imidazole glycerol phosphate synthase subunit HisH [Chloroflexota bacterium]|nr:imidazole glycerol phosphate synthase subunit HisH [Chloroflexota bacterium]
MTNPRIAVIDYGAGNLRSIRRALEATGARVTITSDPTHLATADGIVFPGVGNAGAAMSRLRELRMPPAIHESVAADKPFLGVCLGMQLLFEGQEEGKTEGLGLLPGNVRTLRGTVKSPQMGWNRVRFVKPGPLGNGGEEEDFYFVHSYVVDADNADDIMATTHYGEIFPAVVARDNVYGTQFHPEKSGAAGLRMVEAFVGVVREAMSRRVEAVSV